MTESDSNDINSTNFSPDAAAELLNKLKGKFIVLDGPDGAGKSTQLTLLSKFFDDTEVGVTVARDPGGTVIGSRIREILLDSSASEMTLECELMLYMASRAQLAGQVIRPALARGEVVLCDRYVSATIAYQGASGVKSDMIHTLADIATNSLRPQLTLVLDIDSSAGLSRVGSAPDRIESRAIEYHQRVRQLFLEQAAESPDTFAVVDANGDKQQVHQRILTALAKKFG